MPPSPRASRPQDKCEPPMYVSDRRFMKAVQMLQVAAWADGREQVGRGRRRVADVVKVVAGAKRLEGAVQRCVDAESMVSRT